MRLGAKRNLCVAQCRGSHMAVWDDDDWHGPDRLAAQMKVLQDTGLPACTLSQVAVWDGPTGKAYLSQVRPWECTLLCRRDVLPAYEDLDRGEDTPCVMQLSERRLLARVDAPQMYVYVYHGRNVGGRLHFRRNVFDKAEPLADFFSGRVRTLLEQPVEAPPLREAELSNALPPPPDRSGAPRGGLGL